MINNFYSDKEIKTQYLNAMKRISDDEKIKEYNIDKLKKRMRNSIKEAKHKKFKKYFKYLNNKNIHNLDSFWTFKYNDGSRGIVINQKYLLVLTKKRLNLFMESIKINAH